MKTTMVGFLAVGSVLALAACADPVKDKPQAAVGEAKQASAAPAGDGVAKYAIRPAESKIGFVGAKVTGKHAGGFNGFTGTVAVPGGRVDGAKIEVSIDAATLFTDTEKLTGHLKSPDFFDVEKFPKARFESTGIQAGGAPGQVTITGNLELHGVTRSIRFPATVTVGADAVKADAEFGINRKDFGLVYPGMPDDLIRDEVLIRLAIQAPKA